MQHSHNASIDPAQDQSNGAPEISIYVNPQCADCRQLKEYLQRKRLSFFEHDVTRDVSAQEFLQTLDIEAVPVIRIGEVLVVGFDENRLSELISTPETVAAT